MPTKTIGIREEVYEHLQAHKQGDESFSDVIERLLQEADSDWRTHFGFLDSDEFGEVVAAEREALDESLSAREAAVVRQLGSDEK